MTKYLYVQICGCARSGNTLLQCLMHCLENIETPSNIHFSKEVFVPDFAIRWNYPKDSNNTFVGKQPNALQKLLSKGIPPTLFVIIMIRDGRDVISSSHFTKKDYVSPDRWIENCNQAIKLHSKYPSQTMTLKYENLVNNYLKTMELIGKHIRRQVLYTWEEIASRYKDTFFEKIMKGIRSVDSTNINKWNLENVLSKLNDMNKPKFCKTLQTFGYEKNNSWLKGK